MSLLFGESLFLYFLSNVDKIILVRSTRFCIHRHRTATHFVNSVYFSQDVQNVHLLDVYCIFNNYGMSSSDETWICECQITNYQFVSAKLQTINL